jgi:hypothetical protein
MSEREPIDFRNLPEPDFSNGTTVFALLCNKSAIGIYTSYEKAEEACVLYKKSPPAGLPDVIAGHLYQIKPFKLDGSAMSYPPY